MMSDKEYEALPRRSHIKMEDLKDGFLYRIHARNAKYGIWRSANKSFVISRVKFNDNYLFEEYHWDTGAPFGTAKPFEEIEEVLNENLLDYLNRFEKR